MSPSQLKTPTRSSESSQQNVAPPMLTKIKSSSSQQYQSSLRYIHHLRQMVDDEVRHSFAQSTPLPLPNFMKKHLYSLSDDPVPSEHVFSPDLFAKVQPENGELGMYTPLSKALPKLLRTMEGAEEPTLDFKVTNNLRQNITPELYSMNPDLCALHRARSNEEILWEYVDLLIVVKSVQSADPMSNVSARRCRGCQ